MREKPTGIQWLSGETSVSWVSASRYLWLCLYLFTAEVTALLSSSPQRSTFNYQPINQCPLTSAGTLSGVARPGFTRWGETLSSPDLVRIS